MPSLLTKLSSTASARLRVLGHLLTKRDWVTPVAKQAYDSAYGFDIPDIKGTLNPLFWWEDERLSEEHFRSFRAHNYERGESGIPSWNSEPEVSAFLAKWVLMRKAGRVLELGSFTGFTSVHLAAALDVAGNGKKLTCVDSSTRYLSLALANVKQMVGEHFEPVMIHGFSTDPAVLEQLPGPFDLIFLDTSHDERSTIREFELYEPKLAPGGAFAFHDAIRWPGVRRAVAQVQDGYDKLIFATSGGNGLALLIRR